MSRKSMKLEINDLFKELKEENKRLFDQNKRLSNELLFAQKFIKLCESYRNLFNFCQCFENYAKNKLSYNLLENKYKTLLNERKSLISDDFNEQKHQNII